MRMLGSEAAGVSQAKPTCGFRHQPEADRERRGPLPSPRG